MRAQWEILLTLTTAQLRDRFGRGHWQWIKWLVDPYAATGVYMLFVVFIVGRDSGPDGLIVACAVIPFQLVLQSVLTGLKVVSDRESLIQNLAFPRELLPVAVTLTEALAFAASLTLLPVMMAAYGIAPTAALVWTPVVLGLNMVLALVSAYVAVIFGCWYRELAPFFLSAARILLFLAPGVVALSAITGRANELIRLNPLTGLFEAYRDVFAYGQAPAAWELVLPLVISGAVLAVVVPLMRSEAPHLAKIA